MQNVQSLTYRYLEMEDQKKVPRISSGDFFDKRMNDLFLNHQFPLEYFTIQLDVVDVNSFCQTFQ
jgi:hypothetical protein